MWKSGQGRLQDRMAKGWTPSGGRSREGRGRGGSWGRVADNSNKELAVSKGEEADAVLTGWLTQEGFASGYFDVKEACLGV